MFYKFDYDFYKPLFVMPEIFTHREVEILHLIAEAGSPKDIAAKLKISVRTVEMHIHHANQKVGTHTKAELIRYAIQHGYGKPTAE